MSTRNSLLALAAVIAMAAAPAFAATLSGKVVAVDQNSITVMKDGRSTVYILPSDLEIKSKSNHEVDRSQLRGQTVTLTIDDAMHRQAHGDPSTQPRVSHIRIGGDLNVDPDIDSESGE